MYIDCVLVTQSCPTHCNSMACSPPGSYIYGILQARVLERVPVPFLRGIIATQGWNPGLHCWQILFHWSHQIEELYIAQQERRKIAQEVRLEIRSQGRS